MTTDPFDHDCALEQRLVDLTGNLEKTQAEIIELQAKAMEKQGRALKFLRKWHPAPEEDGDVTFQVNGKTIKADSVVLARKSPVFQSMFRGETKEKQSGVVEVADITYSAMAAMIRFCYTATIEQNPEQPLDFLQVLKAADKYCIEEMMTAVDIAVVKDGEITQQNVMDYAVIVASHNLPHLKKCFDTYCQRNPLEFSDAVLKFLSQQQ